MSANRIIQIVAAESSPEKEEEFNRWYTEKHAPILFGYKGMKQASRYRLIGESEGACKFLTFYEFESKEAADEFHKSPEFATAIEDYEKKKDEVDFTLRWAASYELVKSWER